MLVHIKGLELVGLEMLKNIWKQYTKLEDLILHKLEILKVSDCGLPDLRLSSESFQNLKILHVWNCGELSNILTSS